MSLEATVPAGFTATSLYWRADVIDPNVGELELWEQLTTDGMPAGGWTGGSTVTFGAPGLRESAVHRFRVAYCNANGCTCWSGPSAQYSTLSFPATAPLPPSAIAQEVEDNFHRRPTTVKKTGGDGLGPNEVWLELNPFALSSIASDGETAQILADGTGIYLARQATHQHSFAEVLLGKDDLTQAGFNFEVTGRIHMVTGPAYRL